MNRTQAPVRGGAVEGIRKERRPPRRPTIGVSSLRVRAGESEATVMTR